LRFEAESDPWQRSKMVGQKISQLRKSFRELSNEQRAELAKTGEVEMMTGLQLLGKDKKLIQELVELVDPPAGHLAAHDNNETQDLHNLPPFFFYTICLHCRRFRINLLP